MKNKVDYWLDLCEDDPLTAKALLNAGRLLHMGLFCHMTAEKALKAVVTNAVDEIPPRTHDLQKLAVRGGVFDAFTVGQLALIDRLAPLQIEARYPEYKERIAKTLTVDYCKALLRETEEFLCWIKQRLGK
ncbi:MAG: HEPN domain-containing protein [Clostridiales Family XIII bacterium]|jgi:HEPN domain-containing protein|nr:HEPN domain-containing protein [Clostridiales Family XIII bacterium]